MLYGRDGNSFGLATPASVSEYWQVPSVHPSQYCQPDEDEEGQKDDSVMENQALLGSNNLCDDLDKSNNPKGDSLLQPSNGATSPERMECPTLALTQSQFEMIQNLDTLGFYKLPV
ncbi:hypothetical protein BGX38DRAFT_1143916 [Terfezia claveryi]|nr:hypothetical protein BGX38DRAFT_1143916 [Terfezia claveryi]